MPRQNRYKKVVGNDGVIGFEDRKTKELRAVIVPREKGNPKVGGFAFPAFRDRFSSRTSGFAKRFFNIRRMKK